LAIASSIVPSSGPEGEMSDLVCISPFHKLTSVLDLESLPVEVPSNHWGYAEHFLQFRDGFLGPDLLHLVEGAFAAAITASPQDSLKLGNSIVIAFTMSTRTPSLLALTRVSTPKAGFRP